MKSFAFLMGDKLQQKLHDAIQLRGLSPRTEESYQVGVVGLVRYYKRPPDQITIKEIQLYFLYLVKERELAPASCHIYLNGIRFFYLHVLGRESFDVTIHIPKCPQRIPELLTCHEVATILSAPKDIKHQMLLTCCYGLGLRVSELVGIEIQHIDNERQILRVVQGKGRKDRNVFIGESLLHLLRVYCFKYRSSKWLFCSSYYKKRHRHISIGTAQHVFREAKKKAQITKAGGIHSLRHAYATHQLEAGTSLPHLQRQLGHTDINTTMRYIHLLPAAHCHADLIAGL